MDKFTAVIEGFNTPFSVIDTPHSQNIRKTEGGLNHTTNQLGLADVCRTPPSPHLPPTPAEHTLLSSVHGTFTKVDHILAYETNFNTI